MSINEFVKFAVYYLGENAIIIINYRKSKINGCSFDIKDNDHKVQLNCYKFNTK